MEQKAASPRTSMAAALLGLAALWAVLLSFSSFGSAAAAVTSAPQLVSPDDGSTLPDFEPTLQWVNPDRATQYHLQVTPKSGDGPGVNLIIGSSDISFDLPSPPDWYGLLPDMTYTWRVRVTDAPVSLTQDDGRWGPWSLEWSFRTPKTSSSSIDFVSPVGGGRVTGSTPVLTWASDDAAIFYYEVQVSKDPAFGDSAFLYWNLVHGGVTVPLNSYAIPQAFPLELGTTYSWRVRPRVQGDGAPLPWAPAASFRTPDPGALFLQVIGPLDESTVTTARIQVTGKTKPDTIETAEGQVNSLGSEGNIASGRVSTKFTVVTVDSTLAMVDSAGNFSAFVDLTEGSNPLDIVVSDSSGDVVNVSLDVTYIPPEMTQGATPSVVLAATPSTTPTPRSGQPAGSSSKGLTGRVTAKSANSFSLKLASGQEVSILVGAQTSFVQNGSGKNKPTFDDLKVGMKVSVFGRKVGVEVKPKPAVTRTPTVIPTAARTTTPRAGASPGATPAASSTRSAQSALAAVTPTKTGTPAASPTPRATAPPAKARIPQFQASRVILPRIVERYTHLVGEIIAVKNDSITIKNREGTQKTGAITSQTNRLPPAASFAVGDRVLANARWDDDAGPSGGWTIVLLVKLAPSAGPPAQPRSTPTPARP